MFDTSADRNLLFGILALQMDFITRDQLIVGMQAWVLAKDQPLAEHLVKVGALVPEDRLLLEPLVEAHVRKHGNDPRQSLATISSVGSLPDELTRVADEQLQASLGHFANRPPKSSEDALATLPFAPAAHGGNSTRFRILRPHAEGGLGRVVVARDEELHREVALKEIHPQFAADPELRARFLLEAQVTGGLEHPGIVPIYSLGSYPDGSPFYAMRFVRGKSLKEAIQKFHKSSEGSGKGASATDRNLEMRRLMQRLIDVCQAIEYAHSRGVLHRDLKPGNIMLGKYGETLVVDWGLAKPIGKPDRQPEAALDSNATSSTLPEPPLVPALGSASDPTQQGAAVGTPAFMSPEQAQGRLDLLGPASDVFSLGATLYEILTGRPPYQGSDALRRARDADFQRPRSVNRQIPKPLEAICLKSMAGKPVDRYSTAGLLAQDLEKYLADEPVSAGSESLVEQASRLGRRHKPAVVAGTLALAVLTCASLAFANMMRRKNLEVTRLATDKGNLAQQNTDLAASIAGLAEEKSRLDREERAARQSVEKQRHIAAALRFARNSREARKEYPVRSILLAIEGIRATRKFGNPALPEAETELRAAVQEARGRPLKGIRPDDVRYMSPDGKRIVTRDQDGRILLWRATDVATNLEPTPLTEVGTPIRSIGLSRNGRWLAAVEENQTALWDLEAPDAQSSRTVQMVGSNVRQRGSAQGSLRSREQRLTAPMISPEAAGVHRPELEPAKITSDGKWILIPHPDGGWTAYDVAQGLSTLVVEANADPDESRVLAIVFADRCLMLYDRSTIYRKELSGEGLAKSWLKIAAAPEGTEFFSVAASPDGRFLVTMTRKVSELGLGFIFTVLDVNDGAVVLRGEADILGTSAILGDSAFFTPDSEAIVVAADAGAKVISTVRKDDRGNPLSVDLGGFVRASSFDHRWALVVDTAGTGTIWDLASGTPQPTIKDIKGHSEAETGGSLVLADGRHILARVDGTLRIQSLDQDASQSPYKTLLDDKDGDRGIGLNSDGRWLVALHPWHAEEGDGAATLFDTHSNDLGDGIRPRASLRHQSVVRYFLFDPESRWVATCGDDGFTRVWSLGAQNAGSEIRALGGSERPVLALACSPDGNQLFTAGEEGRVRMWGLDDSTTPAPKLTLDGGDEPISRLAVSHTGRWLAAGTAEGTVLLWDLATPETTTSPRKVKAHDGRVVWLKVAPNGRIVFSGSRGTGQGEGDDSVRMWDVKSLNVGEARILFGEGRRWGGGTIFGPITPRDGRWLIAGDMKSTRIWRPNYEAAADDVLGTGTRQSHHDALVFGRDISERGSKLAMSTVDWIEVSDLDADDPFRSAAIIPSDAVYVMAVTISGNGQWLAALVSSRGDNNSVQRRIRLWNLDIDALITHARTVAGRDLNDEERLQYGLIAN